MRSWTGVGMSEFRRQTWVFVLLALLALFAGCKGESSPTAPPVNGPGSTGTTGTGTTNPPAGAVVTLAVSPATPVIGSASTITATVTVAGKPAPNGTAVEFSSDIGSFCLAVAGCTEPTTNPIRTALRTTTNGVTNIVLSSASGGIATIQAVVNNVTAKTTVNFVSTPVEPPHPDTTPAITAVAPATGRPAGGETVTITGRNFTTPVRVLFTTDTGVTKEGQVISASATEIKVFSPAFDVGTTQQLKTTITVINAAGSASESRISLATGTFTYQSTILTPKVTTASPASGPINGGTRVTIFGEGFQSPLQVFFGAAEAQVISNTFNQIIVLSPAASTTADQGSGNVTGFVDLRIVNINSATTVTAPGVFRYTPKMQITLAGPTEGPYTGGTDVQIDGTGFDDPLSVVLAGVAGQVIRVSGTQLLVRTSPVQPTGCSDVTGPIVVTNGDNGDTATGPAFFYRVPKPFIVSVLSTSGGAINPGSSINLTVLNPGALPTIKIGQSQVNISGATVNPNGTTTFTVAVPPNITLAIESCTAGGNRRVATSFDVVFTSAETTCSVTAPGGLTVSPPDAPNLFLTPNPLTLTARAAVPASAGPPPVAAVPAQNGNGIFTIVNTGTAAATIASVVSSNPNFVITSDPSGQVLAPCDSAIVGVQYIAGPAGSTANGQIAVSVTSSAGNLTRNEAVIGSTQ
jgi:hypothetical protein